MQYFGQKDLSNSADHENGLLEKLVSGKIGQRASVENSVVELCEAVSQLLDVNKVPGQIEEAITAQSEIEHKISIFVEKGVADKLKKQAVYTTDQTKLNSAKKRIETVLRAIKKAYEDNKEVSSALSCHMSEYNADLISDGQRILTLIDQQLDYIGNALQQIQTNKNEFCEVINKLASEVATLSDEFAEIKREIKDDTLDADTFVQLTADMEKAKLRLKQLNKKSNTKQSIEESFRKALRQRNDTLLQLFNAYKAETENINRAQNELRIEIEFKGDKEGFKTKLKSDFRGTGISDAKYQTLSEIFTDYVALIEDWILSDGIELKRVLTSTEYMKLDAKLREQYSDLMNYQVQNKVEIYYHDKLLKHHSIGQRASALILFILTQDTKDFWKALIIESPIKLLRFIVLRKNPIPQLYANLCATVFASRLQILSFRYMNLTDSIITPQAFKEILIKLHCVW